MLQPLITIWVFTNRDTNQCRTGTNSHYSTLAWSASQLAFVRSPLLPRWGSLFQSTYLWSCSILQSLVYWGLPLAVFRVTRSVRCDSCRATCMKSLYPMRRWILWASGARCRLASNEVRDRRQRLRAQPSRYPYACVEHASPIRKCFDTYLRCQSPEFNFSYKTQTNTYPILLKAKFLYNICMYVIRLSDTIVITSIIHNNVWKCLKNLR